MFKIFRGVLIAAILVIGGAYAEDLLGIPRMYIVGLVIPIFYIYQMKNTEGEEQVRMRKAAIYFGGLFVFFAILGFILFLFLGN